jgi:hypothetical protein
MKIRSIIFFIMLNTFAYGQSPSIRITGPRENSLVKPGEMVEIEWEANLIQGDINIYLLNNFSLTDMLITTVNVNEKSYFWYVPNDFSDQDGVMAIEVVSKSNRNISDEVFLRTRASKQKKSTTISTSAVKIVSPRYLQTVKINEGLEIAWDGNNYRGDLNLLYKENNSDEWIYISSLPFNEGSFFWYPQSSVANYQYIEIMIQSDTDGDVFDTQKVWISISKSMPHNIDRTYSGRNFIITKSVDNIRDGPSSQDQIVTKTYAGESFKVEGMVGKWVVIIHNGEVAYTHNSNGYIQGVKAPPASTTPLEWTYNFSLCSVGYSFGHVYFKKGYLITGPSIRMQNLRVGYGAWDKLRTYGYNLGLYYPTYVEPSGDGSGGLYFDYYSSKKGKFIDYGLKGEAIGSDIKIGYRQYYKDKFADKILTDLSGLHLSISVAISFHFSD